MFTTGSKLLIGSAALAWVSALVYGVAQEGALGTIGLISVATALSLIAAINVFVRDSNVSALEPESFESSAAAQATARPSLWPLLVGLGVTTLTLGLATEPVIFVVGLVLIAAGGVEWIIQGWSERASADAEFNNDARELLADPLELPVAGAIIFAGVVYGFSRVMLGSPSKSATVIIFSVVGAVLLAIGAYVAINRSLSKTVLTGMTGLGAVVLIVAGSVYGLNGEREIEEHETPADIAEEDHCVAEETHADEKASQTVAAKSNVSAELTYTGGALDIDVPGFDGDFDDLTLARSNPHNILFRNGSSDDARLVIDLHPAEGPDGEPVGPERICTTLVEPDGVQLMTIEFDRPSFALEAEGTGYLFEVPGAEVSIEVIVP